MHAFLSPPRPLGRPRKPRARLNIVTAYEDLATGQRAQKGYAFLTAELGDDCVFHQSLWRFSALRDPALKAQAVREVGEADLFIVAVHGDAPEELSGLLNAWLAARENRDNALVAVVEPKGTLRLAANSMATRLRKLARHHGLEFLEQPVDNDDPEMRQAPRLRLAWVF